LKIIPPRPIGYSRHRELIKIKTELTFDPLSAAETAADMTFSLILHPARANRLVEQHAREAKLPSLENVIDQMVTATIKSAPRTGLESSVQMAVNIALISNLASLALNKDALGQTKSIIHFKITQLIAWLSTRATADDGWRAHYSYLAEKLTQLQDDPDEYKEENVLPPPPGMPIGDMDLDFCGEFRKP
jgi:hypothetical protein